MICNFSRAGMIAAAILTAAGSAQAQLPALPAPAPLVARVDTGIVPPRDPIIPPRPVVERGPLASRMRPVVLDSVRPMVRPSPPPAAPVVAESRPAEVTPPPIERAAPPAPSAAVAAVGPALTLNVARIPAPAGATGRCKDGTYLLGTADEQACEDRGGLAVVFKARRAAPVQGRAP